MVEGLVSIITPMYNSENYIEDTVNSVLKQTYKNWELLIIDDGSSDKSMEIAEKYRDKDSRIKLLQNEKNCGVVKTRNNGIKNANGRYIAFLDSDDLWDENKLEKQIAFMKKTKAVISCTAYRRVDENNNFKKVINVPEKIDYPMMLKTNLMGCLTVIYDVSDTGKRYFREAEKSEDYIMWLDMIKDVKMAYGLEEVLASYRVLENSRSSNKLKVIKNQWKIYRKYEKLSFFKSVYYFVNYLIAGVRKTI